MVSGVWVDGWVGWLSLMAAEQAKSFVRQKRVSRDAVYINIIYIDSVSE